MPLPPSIWNEKIQLIDEIDTLKDRIEQKPEEKIDLHKELINPLDKSTWFYKNCKRQRKNEAKICNCCPFRKWIEEREFV